MHELRQAVSTSLWMQWESALNILEVRESKASLVLPFQFLYQERWLLLLQTMSYNMAIENCDCTVGNLHMPR